MCCIATNTCEQGDECNPESWRSKLDLVLEANRGEVSLFDQPISTWMRVNKLIQYWFMTIYLSSATIFTAISTMGNKEMYIWKRMKNLDYFCCMMIVVCVFLYSPPSDAGFLSACLQPEQYHLNNSSYGPFGQGLPHPHSNHSAVGLNKYTSLKAVGESHTPTNAPNVTLTPSDTVTFNVEKGGRSCQLVSGDLPLGKQRRWS